MCETIDINTLLYIQTILDLARELYKRSCKLHPHHK